jgi:hypothetical protein
MGFQPSLRLVYGLLAIICCLPKVITEHHEEEPYNPELGEISYSEFLSEYRSRRSKLPEISGLEKYFPDEHARISVERYIEALEHSVDALMHDHDDNALEEKEKFAIKEIQGDVADFVRLTKRKKKMSLKDFYRDVFTGRLNRWLLAYEDKSGKLEPPSDLKPYMDHADL